MTDGTVGVIPARLGATRFPGKLLAVLAGRPVIVHVIQNALSSGLSRVVVATDDDGIARVAGDAGAEVYRSRLAHETGSDRVGEAVRALGLSGSTVVNVQGDEPLLPPSAIAACAAKLEEDRRFDVATLATPLPAERADADSVVKVAVTSTGEALYFSRARIPWGEGEASHLQHVGVYAYRAGALERFLRAPRDRLERAERLEQLRAIACGLKIGVEIVELTLVGVDEPQDIGRAEAVLARQASG